MDFKNREVVVFEDTNGKKLYVSPKAKSVEFISVHEVFTFPDSTQKDLCAYLLELGLRARDTFKPHYCYSEGSDYFEYYDRSCDNNGYLRLQDGNMLKFERPHLVENNRLYLMSMSKLASLLYDMGER